MDLTTISRIFDETAYVRTGGSPESLDESCGLVVERNVPAILDGLERLQASREACLRRTEALQKMEPFFVKQ